MAIEDYSDMYREDKDRKEPVISIFAAEPAETIMGSMGEIGQEASVTIACKEGFHCSGTMPVQLPQLAPVNGRQQLLSEPFFIIAGRYGLSDAQPADTLVPVLDKVTQEVA